MSIFHLGNPNQRKTNNLRLEIIILRSQYNEERKRKTWKCFPNIETLKQPSSAVYANFFELLCTCTLLETTHFTCAVVLLLCEIMRVASYLYRFSTNNLTGADFSWGSNIIFILSFLLLAFRPKVYIVLLGFV